MAKRPDSLETLQLSHELLRRIPKGRTITAPELHQQLMEAGYEREMRTIQRQLETLSEFYDIERDDSSKPYRYRWTQATHDEVLARLLDLNQKRYDQEIIGGAGKGGKKKREEGKKKTTTLKSQPAISEADRPSARIPEPIEQLDVWSQSDF